MKRRSRPLTSEERQLWGQVAAGVRPLKGRALDPELGAGPPGDAEAPRAKSGAPLASPAAAAVPTILPPVGPLERRTVAALRRGRQGVDAAIDLHGLRQDRCAPGAARFPAPLAGRRLQGRPRHHRQGSRGGAKRSVRGARRSAPGGAALAAPARPAAARRRLRGGGRASWRRRRPLRAAAPRAGPEPARSGRVNGTDAGPAACSPSGKGTLLTRTGAGAKAALPRARCRKADTAFRKNSMLNFLESITFMRFDRVDQNAS